MVCVTTIAIIVIAVAEMNKAYLDGNGITIFDHHKFAFSKRDYSGTFLLVSWVQAIFKDDQDDMEKEK